MSFRVSTSYSRTRVQRLIQDFAKRGAASEAESCQRIETETCENSKPFVAGVQGPLIYLHEKVIP